MEIHANVHPENAHSSFTMLILILFNTNLDIAVWRLRDMRLHHIEYTLSQPLLHHQEGHTVQVHPVVRLHREVPVFPEDLSLQVNLLHHNMSIFLACFINSYNAFTLLYKVLIQWDYVIKHLTASI